MPQLGIEMAEKPPRVGLPTPPEVECNFAERFQSVRKRWNNVERVYGLHEQTLYENSVPRGGRHRMKEESPLKRFQGELDIVALR